MRLDSHVPGERGHAERVAVYAVATAEAMGFDDQFLLDLRYGAELHDIGKLLLSADLLLADRPLEPEERAEVERHVSLAEKVLPDDEFLAEARPMIVSHHERLSGGGYPEGLKGDQIPMGSRIIGAAEALDVMLQGAPWRRPFPEEAARAAIEGLSGTWFDPKVVAALLSVQRRIQPLDRR